MPNPRLLLLAAGNRWTFSPLGGLYIDLLDPATLLLLSLRQLVRKSGPGETRQGSFTVRDPLEEGGQQAVFPGAENLRVSSQLPQDYSDQHQERHSAVGRGTGAQ